MSFFCVPLLELPLRRALFIWLDADSPRTVQHRVRCFSLTAFCGKTRRLTHMTHARHFLEVPACFWIVHQVTDS